MDVKVPVSVAVRVAVTIGVYVLVGVNKGVFVGMVTFVGDATIEGGSCVTDISGACSLLSGRAVGRSTSMTFTVTGISHATLAYQPVSNHDPDGDSNGTTITIQKP